MRTLLAGLLFTMVATAAARGDAPAPTACPIFPVPKVYRELGPSWQLADRAAIVVGDRAAPPERYAAERFQGLVRQRFQRTLPILTEGKIDAGMKQLFLLGQPSSHALIARLSRERKLDLSETSPGFDGFRLECFDDDGRQIVLVGGSNARGVIYGQDALFDLMRRDGPRTVFPVVSVQDRPDIAWRGRPHSVLQHHLVPGALDAYMRARINFTDVRDNPNVKPTVYFAARKASMGFPPGVPVDRVPVRRMIEESHRRGLFVYGTVSCAVKRSGIDAVLHTFEELIELGVDGLWISFDDTGAGDEAFTVAQRVIELGKRHGMTGRKIAITPPVGDYETIDRKFNRQCAAVPGMADVQWMFTRVPCETDVAMAKQIGLNRLPGWWHNLEGAIGGGFLHNGEVLCTLRADGRPAYVDMQPLSKGWGRPQYDKIRNAAQCTDTAMLWCVCNGWPEEYEIAALGQWAWNPAGHDWAALRRSVYRYVYGDEQIETARQFDDQLAELKSLFHLPLWEFTPNKGWPCRLKKPADREKALDLIRRMEPLAAQLTERAPKGTAIDPARLETTYLEPMRTTLVYARKMAQLDYPEETLAAFDAKMVDLLRRGDVTAAEQLLTETRAKVKPQLAKIADTLQGLKGIDLYVAHWERRLATLDVWRKAAAPKPKPKTAS